MERVGNYLTNEHRLTQTLCALHAALHAYFRALRRALCVLCGRLIQPESAGTLPLL